MSYCPECLREYVEGTAQCLGCGVRLKPGPPPASRDEGTDDPEYKLVRVRIFSGPTAGMQAELAKGLLQEEGILSMVPGETSAELLPGVDIVQLWVREEDAMRAAGILEAYLDAPQDPGASEDPAL